MKWFAVDAALALASLCAVAMIWHGEAKPQNNRVVRLPAGDGQQQQQHDSQGPETGNTPDASTRTPTLPNAATTTAPVVPARNETLRKAGSGNFHRAQPAPPPRAQPRQRPMAELGCDKPGGLAWMDGLKNATNGSLFAPTQGFTLVCHNAVYCDDAVLLAVHDAVQFNDSKSFVDMRLKYDPEVVVDALHDILGSGIGDEGAAVENWLDISFDDPDTAFVDFGLDDWDEAPEFLDTIRDPALREWASDLHGLWKELGKKIGSEVFLRPERYSQLYVPNPMIVPGDRFKEFYYWDSYWTFLGLTQSEMLTTMRGMLENFIAMIKTYGFIPNGGRVYYENRSQPPLFVAMVKHYLDNVKNVKEAAERGTTLDIDFLEEYIDLIEEEVIFWLTKRAVHFDYDGEKFTLFHYATNTTGARPESFKEDVQLASGVSGQAAKELLYNNLHSACESGWDFSSRWFKPADETKTGTLADTRTRDIVPVDLNSLMCFNARVLGEFLIFLRNDTTDEIAVRYLTMSKEIARAMRKTMYDEETGSWFDFDHELKEKRKNYHPSNAWPLWLDCYGEGENKVELGVKFLEYLRNRTVGPVSPLDFPGGVPTSLVETGQQWDLPNAWPPLVHSMVMALDSVEHPSTKAEAYRIAERWVHTNYVAYKKHGAMFEKYNVTELGAIGSGGEYRVQKGFGWTNGVVLDLLARYGDRLTAPPTPKPDSGNLARGDASPILLLILSLFLQPLLISAFSGSFVSGYWSFERR